MVPSDNTTPHSSSEYDQQIRNTLPYYDSFHQEAINFIKAAGFNPEYWLDTGCGTGTFVEKAYQLFPDSCFVLTDPSREMLEIAQNKLSGMKRIRFLEPVPTQYINLNYQVDLITAIQVHHYLSREVRRQATQACYRLLKDNGLYLTFENIRPFTDQGILWGKKYWSSFQSACGRDPELITKHMSRFDNEFFPISVTEHIQLLKDSGFKTVELLWYSYMQSGFYAVK